MWVGLGESFIVSWPLVTATYSPGVTAESSLHATPWAYRLFLWQLAYSLLWTSKTILEGRLQDSGHISWDVDCARRIRVSFLGRSSVRIPLYQQMLWCDGQHWQCTIPYSVNPAKWGNVSFRCVHESTSRYSNLLLSIYRFWEHPLMPTFNRSSSVRSMKPCYTRRALTSHSASWSWVMWKLFKRAY